MAAKVGIRDVAEMAGVSAGTVSKVLKNYSGISESTKNKVMAVVEQTGFIPNSVASALSAKKNNRIALFICINDRPLQMDEINMLYLMGAFEQARKENLELVTVFNASIENLSNEETARYFHSIHVEAIVVLGLNKSDEKIHYLAQQGNLKIVLVDAFLDGDQISTVMIDHARGQYDTADQICEPGDRVLYLKGKDNEYVTGLRLEGRKELAKDKKLQLDVVDGDYSEERAYEIVKDLGANYDAIVCASDLMAIGARQALPESSGVKISGFNGIRLMEYVAEDVITCRQDFREIGAAAVEAAEKLLRGGKGELIRVPYSVTRIRR